MTLDPQVHALDGPDFLDAVADAEEVSGLLINAAEYRRRARQWREDLLALSALSAPESKA
jgi:hypothetical protein